MVRHFLFAPQSTRLMIVIMLAVIALAAFVIGAVAQGHKELAATVSVVVVCVSLVLGFLTFTFVMVLSILSRVLLAREPTVRHADTRKKSNSSGWLYILIALALLLRFILK
jgi:hypothetical protein